MDRWTFLAPWRRVLKAHELHVCTSHNDFRDELHALTVSVCPSKQCDGQTPFRRRSQDEKVASFLALRDSLELVLLLAIVDRQEFNAVVSASVDAYPNQASPFETARVLEFQEGNPLRHVLLRYNQNQQFDPSTEYFVTDALAAFITPQPLHERDAAFQDARQRLLDQIDPSETGKRHACENLKVSVSINHHQQIMPLRLMRLQEKITASVTTDPKLRVTSFVADDFTLPVTQTTFSPDESMRIESRLMRGALCPYNGVSISSDGWRSPKQFGLALSAALQPTRSGKGSIPRHTVNVCIRRKLGQVHFAQLFSALLHTRGLQSLWLPLFLLGIANDHDRRLRLRWFVFTVFSRWATHNLKFISVDSIKITDEEAQDLLHFLRCANPLPLLFSKDHSDEAEMPEAPAKQVLARAGAEVELDVIPGCERESILLSEVAWLDVIGEDARDEGRWVVLVPAYGKCRISRADTLQVRFTEVSGPFVNEGLTSLSVYYHPSLHNEEGQERAGFFRCFGASLEVLRLRHLGGEEGATLAEVLASCRSLKWLALPVTDSGVLPHLVEAYETGACKASRLEIWGSESWPDLQKVLNFLESMADPTQRISGTVRELIFICEATKPAIPTDQIAAMRKMLTNNPTLLYFERRCQIHHNAAFVELCREHNNARHTMAIPLELRSKCAFLSAVWSDQCSVGAAMQLDTVMITRIFEMATELVVRRAVVSSAVTQFY